MIRLTTLREKKKVKTENKQLLPSPYNYNFAEGKVAEKNLLFEQRAPNAKNGQEKCPSYRKGKTDLTGWETILLAVRLSFRADILAQVSFC